jgi:hypothetical protein
MNKIEELIELLGKREDDKLVTNQYKSEIKRQLLSKYLCKMLKNGSKILIMGEAGGHKGALHSGIPFTSTNLILKHNLLSFLRSDGLSKKLFHSSESSATIVYSFFDLNQETFSKVVIWNSFPFHPHKDNLNSNRKPSSAELDESEKYILKLFEIFHFEEYYPIGNVADSQFQKLIEKKMIPKFDYGVVVRHPSFGGKSKFIQNMCEIFGIKVKKIKQEEISNFI